MSKTPEGGVIPDFQAPGKKGPELAMASSLQELEGFHRFAKSCMESSTPTPTLEQCLVQWRQEQEAAETLSDIRESLRQSGAGAQEPLDSVMQELLSSLPGSEPGR